MTHRIRASIRRHDPAKPIGSKLEVPLLASGLVLAVAAGVIGYSVVGPYGNGPFKTGERRIAGLPGSDRPRLIYDLVYETTPLQAVVDVADGTEQVAELRFDTDRDGVTDTTARLDGGIVRVVERDLDGDGLTDQWAHVDESGAQVKVEFSLARDGVADAWVFSEPGGRVTRVEVSTARDGVIDRWEFLRRRRHGPGRGGHGR